MTQEARIVITENKTVELPFKARQCMVQNVGQSWVFVRIGGTDFPTAGNYDWAIPPFNVTTFPVQPVRAFAFSLSTPTVMLPTSVPTAIRAIVTLTESEIPLSLGNVSLSPSGFRYREGVESLGHYWDGNIQHWWVAHNNSITRDLSNFSNFRYVIYAYPAVGKPPVLTVGSWQIILQNVAADGTVTHLGFTWTQNQLAIFTVHGSAGGNLKVLYQVGAPADALVILGEQLEAWSA